MKQIKEYIRIALFSVFSSKLRSFLTMLGIIIGIASMIIVLAAGNGVRSDVMASESTSAVTIGVDVNEVIDIELITMDDLEALRNQLGNRITGIVTHHVRIGMAETTRRRYEAFVTFTLPDAEFDPEQHGMYSGQYLDDQHVMNASLVGVINLSTALLMYGTTDVLGMEVDLMINGIVQTVRLIGVRYFDEDQIRMVEETAELLNAEVPVFIELPYTAYTAFGGNGERFASVTVYLAEGEDEIDVATSIISILSARHLSEGTNLFVREQLINWNVVDSLLDIVMTFFLIVASISILVGGIGVMNIMLVSVTERRREIGIRKALGAKTGSIIIQFLFESTILSGIGGVIGILLGMSVSYWIGVSEFFNISTHLTIWSVISTSAFACGVGVVFGIYPAKKAAKLSPIEALREL